MAELTVTVQGAGSIGRAHLFAWSQLSGVRIVSICDSDGSAAARAATDYAAPAFTSLEASLGAERVDIVDLCAVEALDDALLALRSGAHVLLPVPFTKEPEALRQLAAYAADRERTVMPALLFRFHPIGLLLREMVASDDFGALTMVRCRIAGTLAQPGDHNALTGAALHALDLIQFLCGTVQGVCGFAAGDPVARESDAIARVTGVARTAHALGVFEGSAESIGARSAVEVYGTAGAAIAEFDSAVVRYQLADQPVWQSVEQAGAGALERLLVHFTDVLRGLQEPLCSVEDVLHALEWLRSVQVALP